MSSYFPRALKISNQDPIPRVPSLPYTFAAAAAAIPNNSTKSRRRHWRPSPCRRSICRATTAYGAVAVGVGAPRHRGDLAELCVAAPWHLRLRAASPAEPASHGQDSSPGLRRTGSPARGGGFHTRPRRIVSCWRPASPAPR
jgi:hypothetical protein